MLTLTFLTFLAVFAGTGVIEYAQHPFVQRGRASIARACEWINDVLGFNGSRFLGATAGMVRVPQKTPTFGQAHRDSMPTIPGQPETIPWKFYDTQLYTSGTTTQLTFFTQTSNDRSISNMVNAGSLPEPQYFYWYYWGVDILLRPRVVAASSPTGPLDDIAQLVLSGRGTATFFLSDKEYGPFPLSDLHASGGPVGFLSGTLAAGETAQYANNGIFDGGWCWNGMIIIPPKQGFRVVLNWPAALTLEAGNTNIRTWMLGQLARKVQ